MNDAAVCRTSPVTLGLENILNNSGCNIMKDIRNFIVLVLVFIKGIHFKQS